MPWYAMPSLVSWLFLSGLGVFVLTRNPRHLMNQSFALAWFGYALLELSLLLVLLTKSVFWARVAFLGGCLIPTSLAIFSVTFARQNYQASLKQWKFVIGGVIGGSLGFLYFGLNGRLVTKTSQFAFSQFEVYNLQPAGNYFCIFLVLTSVFILHNLENTYRNASSSVRWEIKYLVIGICTALFFQIFLMSYMLLYNLVRVSYFVAESFIMIIAGFMVAFSLVRHRLLGTDVFISRQVVYSSVVLFVTGAYLIAIAAIGYLVKYQFIQRELTQFLVVEVFMYVAVIGLMLLLLSAEVRRRVERYISKHFYKHKYEYDEVWIAFTRRIGSNIRLDDLLPQIVNSVQDILKTDRVFLFLPDEARHQLVLRASSLPLPQASAIPMSSQLVAYFQQTPTPQTDMHAFQQTPALQAIYQEQHALFETLAVALCAPLRITDQVIGLLAVGAERTGEPYSHEDYELVYTICIQAASAILNARLSEDLLQARALETFHQFAAFIMHDLKNAVQNLSFVVQNAPDYLDDPEFWRDAVEAIADTVTRMNDLITKLSAVPEKIELHRIDTRLDQFLADTLKKSKASKLEQIAIQVDGVDPTLTVPLDYQHFQSVLLNLLSNAAEAMAEQGNIHIQAARKEHAVEIVVSDTGCGIPAERLKTLFTPFKSTKKKGLGIGLYQCKTIVEAHGGKIYVDSDIRRGTAFRIELPLELKLED